MFLHFILKNTFVNPPQPLLDADEIRVADDVRDDGHVAPRLPQVHHLLLGPHRPHLVLKPPAVGRAAGDAHGAAAAL